ncbi:hypothetical protein J8628_02575 [Serratia fonticola]|jgi:hypothetical protein|uniref:hypothetical protein n=1 Tax=Serratia fonticola TaxID=47917 RepID=UPI001AE1B420|nr:hypothetical protein [Serratia fonticola]MBP1015792.1 hypothetical protein [Serratia fonticola]
MKNSTRRLIEVSLGKSLNLLAVKLALKENDEGGGSVNLENVYDSVSSHITPAQFSGYISALTQKGSYIPRGEGFGTVIYN